MHRFHECLTPVSVPVTVVIGGCRETFPCLQAAVRPYAWNLRPCGDGEGLVFSSGPFSLSRAIRFLDSADLEIPPRLVLACADAVIARYHADRLCRLGRKRYDPSDFRLRPVPGTGRRGGWGRWLRRMRTTQERRAAEAIAHDEDCIEVKVKARARRNFSNLVNAWDDVPRGCERSWKRVRRTQWKERGG